MDPRSDEELIAQYRLAPGAERSRSLIEELFRRHQPRVVAWCSRLAGDGSIACGLGGGGCSAKFAEATVVTLRATPPAGAQFLGWGGTCSGTAPVCQVVIAKGVSVQANFSK